MPDYDALVIGGGVAGLSAGLWLGRYRRRVRILDSGQPRNAPTWAVHGYPGLSNPPPHELRRVLIEQARTAGAEWEGCEVTRIDGAKDAFTVRVSDDRAYRARRIILAYGRRDEIPDVAGLRELYGISVFHCPDCDGPSMVDARLAVLGWDRSAAILALFLLTWARQVSLLTNGREPELDTKARSVLQKYHVEICTPSVARLCADNERLVAVEFADGDALPVDGLFFHLGSHPASDLADQLGCRRDHEGNLDIDNSQETSVPGVYAAGDLVGPPYLAISAAAKGVKSALSVHKSLLPADLAL